MKLIVFLTLFAVAVSGTETTCADASVECPGSSARHDSKSCFQGGSGDQVPCDNINCCSWGCPEVYESGGGWETLGNTKKDCPDGLGLMSSMTCGDLACDDSICCKKTCASDNFVCSTGLTRWAARDDTECDFGDNGDECHDSVCCIGHCGEAFNGVGDHSFIGGNSCPTDTLTYNRGRETWDPTTCADEKVCTLDECCVPYCTATVDTPFEECETRRWDFDLSFEQNYCSGDCTREFCCKEYCSGFGGQQNCPENTVYQSDIYEACPEAGCDADFCCYDTCASYTCPEGSTAVDISSVACPDGQCTDDLCCKQSCSSYVAEDGNSCPADTRVKSDDSPCETKRSVYTPDTEDGGCSESYCCNPTCGSHTCPEGSEQKTDLGVDPGDRQCETGECTDQTCCTPPDCSSYTCPEGKALIPENDCGWDTPCDEAMCCADACASVGEVAISCPSHTKFAGDLPCQHGPCNTDSCCAGHCYGFSACPDGQESRTKDDYHTCHAGADACTANDCCRVTCAAWAMSDANECPTGLSLNTMGYCSGESGCDVLQCCKAVCGGWYAAGNECEAGYEQRSETDMHDCGPGGCDSFQCCRGDCQSFNGMECDAINKRHAQGPASCAGGAMSCTADECCADKATCADVTEACDAGEEKKGNDHTCNGAACSKSECCAPSYSPDSSVAGGTYSADDEIPEDSEGEIKILVTWANERPTSVILQLVQTAYCAIVENVTGTDKINCWSDDGDENGVNRNAFYAKIEVSKAIPQSQLDEIQKQFLASDELTAANGGQAVDESKVTTTKEDSYTKFYYRIVLSLAYYEEDGCTKASNSKAEETLASWKSSDDIEVCESSLEENVATVDGVLSSTDASFCNDINKMAKDVCDEKEMSKAVPFCGLIKEASCSSECEDAAACEKAAEEAGVTLKGVGTKAPGGSQDVFSAAAHAAPAFVLALSTFVLV